MTGLLLFISLAAVLAAVYFFASHRTSSGQLAGKEAALRKLEEQAAGASDEAAELRDQLREAKKKAFDQAEAVKKAAGAPALREEIEKLSTRLADARAEAAAAAERARALEAQAASAARELERGRAEAAAALERARAESLQAAQAAAEPLAAPPPPAGPDESQLRAEKERADKAEAKLAEVRKKAADLERDVKVAKGRLETDRRVYMVQKGEPDIAKDRYLELKRRHDALRKEHEELIDAVRQAAREERKAQEAAAPPAAAAPSATPPEAP